MKKTASFYFLFTLLQICFADISLDKDGPNKAAFSAFNYLPLTIGILFALGIFDFIHVYKKEKNATK